METCSGNMEEEEPCVRSGLQADAVGGEEAGRPGFAVPGLKGQHGRRHRGTEGHFVRPLPTQPYKLSSDV